MTQPPTQRPATDAPSPNRSERRLLWIVAAFMLTNTLALALQRGADLSIWLNLTVWGVCALVGTHLLSVYLPDRDPVLFPLVMFMSGWGLVTIDRLLPVFADRQTIWLGIATAGLLTAALWPRLLQILRTYRYTLLLLGLALLLATILLGRNPSGFGPELWLGFGPAYFQPSEALKIILVAFLASYLGEQAPLLRTLGKLQIGQQVRWLSPRIIGPIALMWGLSMVILIWQRDLGTAVLFFAVFMGLLYVASGQMLILLVGSVLILAASVAAYALFDVVQLRVDIWLNPWPEADNRAYQIVQSLMAFASGSIFGDGIAQGAPIYIPVIHSDFIFAAIAEEWGLLGVIGVVGSMAVFVVRGMRTAVYSSQHPFHALFAVGLSLTIGVQSLLIMAGVLKIMPLTGVTLPYFSYGGSSLLVSFIAAGFLLQLSAEAHKNA